MKNLKKTALIGSFSLAMFMACAQTSETRKISDFTKLESGGAVEVKLYESDLDYVKIESKKNVSENVFVESNNGTLKVYTKGNINSSVVVSVPYKKLSSIMANGASRITADKVFDAEQLVIICLGASSIDLSFNTNVLVTEANGAAQLKLKGKAKEHQCQVKGASNLDADQLITENTRINAEGASHAEVNSNKKLTIDASGASQVVYSGNPQQKNIETSTASSVKTM